MRVIKEQDFWYFINDKGESLKIEADTFYDKERLRKERDEATRQKKIQFISDYFVMLSYLITAGICFTFVYIIKKLIEWNIRAF